MNAKKRQNLVPATPISKLLATIEKGFEFNPGDFSIMEETEEEEADASQYPDVIGEEDEEEMDVVVDVQGESETSCSSGSNAATPVAKFVDTRPRRARVPLASVGNV